MLASGTLTCGRHTTNIILIHNLILNPTLNIFIILSIFTILATSVNAS